MFSRCQLVDLSSQAIVDYSKWHNSYNATDVEFIGHGMLQLLAGYDFDAEPDGDFVIVRFENGVAPFTPCCVLPGEKMLARSGWVKEWNKAGRWSY